MDSNENKAVNVGGIELTSELSGLFHRHYDMVLADDSLSDMDVILLGLYLIEHNSKSAGASYDNCKNLFTLLGRRAVNFKANVHNAKKKWLIEQKDSILYLTIGGLKRIRKVLGQIEKSPVHVIKSGQSFTAIKLLEEFLAQEIQSEEILFCDPHISSSTLFPLSRLKGKVRSIKILTSNVHDSDKFREYKKKMEKETDMAIGVRLTNKIHDRYLISGDRCWSFGASIKDLGNKDTTIREISEVTASMKDLFAERWDESNDFS